MDGDLRWIVGIAVSIVLAVMSLAVGGFWKIMAMIRAIEHEAETEHKTLHGRINRLGERAVQKPDLDQHLARIETMIREARQEHIDTTRAITDRLDKLIQTQNNH